MTFHKSILSTIILVMLLSPLTILASTTVPDAKPLPAWETQEEKALRAKYGFPNPVLTDTPPTGSIESYAEWAPSSGVIIAWMSFESFLTDMVREFVQVGTSWIVVESASQQTSVSNLLVSEGIPLDNVEFMIFNMDSVWMVDYGPFFVQVDGEREIIDNIYDRYGRWNDDEYPSNLAGEWTLPVYESDLRIEGGNFIADGTGICFITNRVIEQNQGYLTEQEVYNRLETYCGCETVHVLNKINDGTGHIDMFAKLLDADTMLMGQYDPGDPEYTTLENNATTVAGLVASTGEHYEVVRIPMPGNPGDYWTYTNSIIVNNHVYVPVYDDPLDATALAIYAAAMPGYTIVPIDSSSVIGSGGAVHCTTKVVPTASEYALAVSEVVIDDSSGDGDSILDPGETAALIVSLSNQGIQPLTGVSGNLTCQESGYVTITTADAVWPDIPSGTSAESIYPHFIVHVDSSTPSETDLHFELSVVTDDYSATENFVLTASSADVLISWDMETDPGWTVNGDWAWGIPQGNDGDPSGGFTGSNVYGYNLSGAYANNLAETALITTTIDCSAMQNLELRFKRWLGVENSQYDHASIDVSNDGTTWTGIWENPGSSIEESSWTDCSYDISNVADNEPTVYIRWIMGSTDSSVTYCGWNIDDVEIWGVNTLAPTATPDICIHHGDSNLDGTVTAADAQQAFLIALGSYAPTYEEECASDCNGDGDVTAGDAQGIFQTAIGTGSCVDPLP